MKAFWFVGLVWFVNGCDSTTVDTGDGHGDIEVIITQCLKENDSSSASGSKKPHDLPGVVATCDDHLPCTVDIQCTPCSVVPEPIRFVKATCTPDDDLAAQCYDSATNILLYTGCVHFIQDPTPQGVKNACFPVAISANDDSIVPRPGVCNWAGVCVDNPP